MPETLFGIIGKPLGHSFSPEYFREKFVKLRLSNHRYEKFELSAVEDFPELIRKHPNLIGLNVTLPYKSTILPFLNQIDDAVAEIGAANTLAIHKSIISGYNTDVEGFQHTLKSLNLQHGPMMVLGDGGVSKAVQYVLKLHQIPFKVVSRKGGINTLNYSELNKPLMDACVGLINCTSLGMYPNTETAPNIPYRYLNSRHVLIDLVYNPRVTRFLQHGLAKGCRVKNGFQMLVKQAEASWRIWQKVVPRASNKL